MDITPLVPQGQQIIQSYSNGRFRISGQVYEGPVIVFADHTLHWPVQKAVSDMGVHDFSLLFCDSGNIDVLLMGCGRTMAPIPFDLRRALKDKGIVIEFMDTGAACRTYNVLITEGRRVAAALLGDFGLVFPDRVAVLVGEGELEVEGALADVAGLGAVAD